MQGVITLMDGPQILSRAGQEDRNDSAGAGRGVSGLTDQGDESTEGRIRLDK